MPSTVQREAMSRALRLLSARERNVLTVNRQHGLQGVAEMFKNDRVVAQGELDRIKIKLEVAVRRELRRPPEDAVHPGRSLGAPDGPPRRDGPVLRSSGLLPMGTDRRRAPKFKEKDCEDCGGRFLPKGSRQVKCPVCRGETPVVVRHDESVIRERPVEEAALDAAGIEPPSNGSRRVPYPLLRGELDAIRQQLNNFADGLDRLMEGSANNNTRAKEVM